MVYVYTPRGDIRAKQAKNPLKLDVSRDFVIFKFTRRKLRALKALTLKISPLVVARLFRQSVSPKQIFGLILYSENNRKRDNYQLFLVINIKHKEKQKNDGQKPDFIYIEL